MKKLLVILLAALAVLPLMADGTVGLTAGAAFDWWKISVTGGDAADYSETDVNVAIAAEQFFGDSGFGVAFGVGVNVPLSAVVPKDGGGTEVIHPLDPPKDGTTTYYLFPIMWNPSLGVVYRLRLGSGFAVKFGLGASVTYGAFNHTTTVNDLSGDTTYSRIVDTTQLSFGAYGDVAASYTLGGFEAKLGARATYVFKTNLRQVTTINGKVESDTQGNKTGFLIMPYAGVTYRF